MRAIRNAAGAELLVVILFRSPPAVTVPRTRALFGLGCS